MPAALRASQGREERTVHGRLGTWVALSWALFGFADASGDPAVAPGTGAPLRATPASCSTGPTLWVPPVGRLGGDAALVRLAGGEVQTVAPSLGPWRDAALICAGEEPWLWAWRDDGDDGPVTGLFPVVDGGLGTGLTLDGRWVEPRPSPSGRFVVLREDGGEGAQTLVELATHHTRPLAYGGTVTDGAWIPGADTLLVVVDAEGAGPHLVRWDPGSRGPARETAVGGRHARPGTLAVSPDGRRAAFAVGGQGPGLRVVELATGDVARIPGPGVRPTWSPSGRAVAAIGERDGDRELVVWRSADGVTHRHALPHTALGALTDGPAAVWTTWLDDQRLLLGSRWGSTPLRVLEKGHLRELRVPPLPLDAVARTPDGAVWGVARGDLWRVGVEGRARRVAVPLEAGAVTVRPDGAVWVVDRDGREAVRVGS